MARASEKKDATLRTEATNFYRPFLISINVIYIVLRWYVTGSIISFQNGFFPMVRSLMMLLLLSGLQYYAYNGIIHDSVNRKREKKSSTSSSSNSSTSASTNTSNSTNLDLLGLVLFIQFGAILLSSTLYYLLLLIPIWAGWYLYKTFYGGSILAKQQQKLKLQFEKEGIYS